MRPTSRVPLTAMIDVVFLLLIFFVWTSRFDPAEGALAASTTKVASDQASPPPEPMAGAAHRLPDLIVGIQLDASGGTTYRWQGRSLETLDAVRNAATQLASLPRQPGIVIDPAPEVTLQSVVALHDALRQAGLGGLTLAAQGPP